MMDIFSTLVKASRLQNNRKQNPDILTYSSEFFSTKLPDAASNGCNWKKYGSKLYLNSCNNNTFLLKGHYVLKIGIYNNTKINISDRRNSIFIGQQIKTSLDLQLQNIYFTIFSGHFPKFLY